MRRCHCRYSVFAVGLLVALVACREQPQPVPLPAGGGGPQAMQLGVGGPADGSDVEKVRDADVSILFVGNSHTMMHDVPGLVARMVQFRRPEKTVYTHFVWVGFLEDAAGESKCKQEIETRPWKHVVLQAQKVSGSGRFDYSRQEGIDVARLAKARGASVVFFAEWGLRGVANNGPRHEKIYSEMASVSGAQLAPVGRAWDLALAKQPKMALHAPDGNHQSAVGAYLTACVLYGRLLGENPSSLAAFVYPDVNESDRALLANAAATALAINDGVGDHS